MSDIKVLGIGDNVCDKYLHEKKIYPGGNALNIAVFAKLFGTEAAYLGTFGDDEVGQHLRVTARASDEKEARKLLKPMLKELKKRFGSHIYATNEATTLEESIVALLKEKNLTLTTAESCTGGMLSARLTNVPGVSEVFKQGFVAYSNRAKRKLLDVKKNTLKTYGAVSEKTAKEMAKNGAFITGSDICVSITGLAGPDGGTETTPVGLVYIACAYQNELRIREFHFKGNRQKIRELSTVNALTLLRSCILEKETAGK